MEFQTPVDIVNRGLQVIGAPRIVAFTDDSVSASETSFVYDKIRQAELQRNNWRFGIRTVALRALDQTVLQFVPAVWSEAATYPAGAIVSYNDQVWQALDPVPAGQAPDPTNTPGPSYWDVYFGPMSVTQWAAPIASGSESDSYSIGLTSYSLPSSSTVSEGYYAGELVYISNGLTYEIFLSLVNGNAANPSTYPAWDPTVVYSLGQVIGYPPPVDVTYDGVDVTYNGVQVTYGGQLYQSTIDLNLNQTPGTNAAWEAVSADEADGLIGSSWMNVGGSLETINIIYPIGSGPGTQTTTRNVFLIPNGFLKKAPQDPRAGDYSFLGSPGNISVDDWVFQGDYITSSADSGLIILRFMADVTSVPNMTAMFCEGLAARIGEEVCETITQSTAKMQAAAKRYSFFMGEARMSNAIENGADFPPLEDYIACRI